MNRSEKIKYDYEDALFAVLMDQVAEAEGERLLAENERLQNDPDAAVPDNIDRLCRKTIRRSSARRWRKSSLEVMKKAVGKVAVVLMIATVLFTGAYAAIPEVRLSTLNLLIKNSELASRMVLVPENNGKDVRDRKELTLMGYILPELPQSFFLESQNENSLGGIVRLKDGSGASVVIQITKDQSAYVDNESIEESEAIDLHGYQGMLLEKDNSITISWYDAEHESLIMICSDNVRKPFIISVAEGLSYSE